ncbi:hypothetical protein QZH41_008268, partial [Actinostola sp. cb2023]
LVVYFLVSAGTAPSINTHPINKTTTEWQTVSLVCIVSGDPTPTVRWWKDGQLLDISANPRLTQEAVTNSLTITNITRNDEGFYYCNATINITSTPYASNSAYVEVNYPAKIFISPQNDTKVEGQNVTFECSLEGKPLSVVTWWHGNTKIDTSVSRYSVSGPPLVGNSKASLTITNVVRDDEGFYYCKANNDLGTVESDSAYLTVNYPSKILVNPSPDTKIEKEDVTLSCQYEGKPKPTVEWFVNDTTKLNPSDPRIQITNTGDVKGVSSLTIYNLNRTDEGRYKCVVNNSIKANVSSTEAQLTVNYPAKIFISPKNATKKEEESVTFECSLEGKPLSEVTWWHGNTKIDISVSRYSISGPPLVGNSKASLTITNVVRDDEGFYRCKAQNDLGTVESDSAYLTVNCKWNHPSKILVNPSPDTKIEKEDVTLSCQYEGKPKPTVEWFVNDTTKLNPSDPRIQITNTGDVKGVSSLTIYNLNRTDEGRYKCVVNNSIKANVSSTEAQLTVNYPPFILVPPSLTTTNESNTVTLTCEVEGKPKPTVTWLKNGVEVGSSDSRITKTHPWSYGRSVATLTINNANRSDEGVYTCHASNGIGANATSSSSIANLIVNYPAKIFISPKNATKKEEESVTFECSLEGKPLSEVTWWHGNTKIDISVSRYSISGPPLVGNSKASLTITNVVRDDEGFYRCKAQNDLGTVESDSAYLTVNFAPTITTHPPNRTTTEWQTVSLVCIVSGDPIPTVGWWKDGQLLNISAEPRLTQEAITNNLTITNITRNDEGFYYCNATNNITSTSSNSAYVEVNYPAKFFISPQNDTQVEGQNVTLECSLEGKPLSEVTWWHGSTKINTSVSRYSVSGPPLVSNSKASLTITNVVRDDEGFYYCKANNDLGTVESDSAYLTVNYPPKILVNPSPDTKIEKENVTLSCKYEGKPKPTVEWFVNDTTKLNPSDPRIQITNTGDVKKGVSSLTIYNLNRTDEGHYKCVLNNSIKANVASTETQLTVNYPPVVLVPPSLTTTNESITAILTCEVEGKPKPTVTWLKNGVEVGSSDSRITKTHPWSYGRSVATLTINNANRSDEGVYTCHASNGIGANVTSSSSSANLIVNCEYFMFIRIGDLWKNIAARSVSLTCDPSKILVNPSPDTKIEKENVTLSCEYEGKPKPTVEWFVNDTTKLNPSDLRIQITNTGDVKKGVSSLTIYNLNRTDEGRYKCVVNNSIKANVSSNEAQLTVNYPPVVLVPPSLTTTNESNNVTLTCEVEGKPKPTVTWLKNDVEVGSSDSRITKTHPWSYGRSVATLTINNANRSDEGVYTCHASNGIGANVTSSSSSANLIVNYPAKIFISPQNDTKIEGQNVTFECSLEGKPLSVVTWWHGNTKIESVSRYSVSGPLFVNNSKASLTITNVVRDDEGFYYCKANNDLGTVESDSAYLTVNYPSKILVNPSPDTKIEKENVTLSCEYEGKPKPTVEWFVNDTTKLNPSDLRIQITNTGDVKKGVSSLTIYNLNRTDEGRYKCVVNNSIKANVASNEAQLTVNYPAKIFISPQNDTKVEGQNVTFECSLEGKPLSEVTWWHGNTKIDTGVSRYSVSVPFLVGNSKASLTITNVVRDDEGFYYCKAQNDLGTVESDSAYFTVNYPPKILVNASSDTKIEKENVTLSCEYEGKPKPTVEWFVNDTTKLNPSDPRIQITNTGDVKKGVSSLTIYNLNRTDEGRYKCVLNNSIKANVSSTEAQLTVNYPPKIFISPKNATKKEGESVTFECSLEGKPLSEVTWWHGNTKIDTSVSRYIVSGPPLVGNSKASLKITKVVRGDEGFYYCKAKNKLTTDVSNAAYFTVRYPPVIFVNPLNDTKNEGETATMWCEIEGKPLSNVTWKHGNIAISNGGRISINNPSIVGRANSTLTISNLVRSDEGSYTCTATNADDTVVSPSSSGRLTVNCKYECFLKILSLIIKQQHVFIRHYYKDEIHYSVLIAYKGNGRKPSYLELEAKLNKSTGNPYITGLFGVHELQKFKVGDDKYYPRPDFKSNCKNNARKRRDAEAEAATRSPNGKAYHNKPLVADTSYSFVQRAATARPGKFEYFGWTPTITIEKKETGSAVPAIVGGILAAIVVLCIIALVLVYLRKRKRDAGDDELPMRPRRGTKSRLGSIARLKHSHGK